MRAQATHFGERTVDGTEDVTEGDRGCRTRERVPAAGSAGAHHEVGHAQVTNDRLEELARKILLTGERVDTDRALAGRVGLRQREHRPNGVLGASGDVHDGILPHR